MRNPTPWLAALAAALTLSPLRALAQETVEKQVAKDRAKFDQAKPVDGGVAPADSGQAAQAPDASQRVYPDVDQNTLKQANAEVLALRDKVWAGQLDPAKFYGEVQKAYENRFGPDYAKKIKTFLDVEAAAAPKPAQTVDFARMTDAERQKFFRDMPKGGELHLHLTGAIPGEKILEIGEQLGTKLPLENILKVLRIADLSAYGVDASKKELTVAEMPAKLRADVAAAIVTKDSETFAQFLDKWKIIGPISADRRSFYPMIRYLADVAKAQNVSYLEIMVPGYAFGSMGDPVTHTEVQQAAADAAKKAEKETGVVIRLLASNGWYSSPKQDQDAIAEAEQLYPEVVGFDMVADERLNPLNHYTSFQPLRDKLSKLEVSLHSGEQPGTASNIVNDLLLNPKRYGHCTNVEENPIAEAVLYENKIPVEVSLISNKKVRVMTDLSKHPEPKFLGWGIPVIPDTDDPGVFGSTLSQEYQLSQSQFGLSWDQLKEMSRNGIRYSFADAKTKARLLKQLDERLAKFERSAEFKKHELAPAPAAPPQKVRLDLQ